MSAKTALVVDDSKSARFAMRKFLEGFGYQVDTAESAEGAYACLRDKVPDVMFVDHIMPGTDGFTAIRAIKHNAHTATLPVVLCSSNEGEEFLRQARACGAIDVLQKPPSKDQLRSVLDHLKEHREVPAAAAVSAPVTAPADAAADPAAAAHPHEAAPIVVTRTPARDETPPRLDALREEMEARLRKITQDLFRDMAEIKAQLAHTDAAAHTPRDDEHLRGLVLRVVEPQIDALTRNVEGLLTGLRGEVDELLATHDRSMDRLRQEMLDEVRRATAHTAQRVSEQIAEALLRGLRPAEAASGFDHTP
ncbi:MAG: response regulator [Nevskia sp.]|nr:response regulator [Nevskia sp.]